MGPKFTCVFCYQESVQNRYLAKILVGFMCNWAIIFKRDNLYNVHLGAFEVTKNNY